MLETTFDPFPELSSPRLLLRRLRDTDANAIFELRSNELVLRYMRKEPIASLEKAQSFIARVNAEIDDGNMIMWAIELRDSPGQLIGTVGFWRIERECYRAEVGLEVHPDFWRNGYGPEATGAIVDYGLNTLGLHSIESRIAPDNAAVERALVLSGWTKEGHLKEAFCFRGEFIDTAIYSILQPMKR